MFSLLHFIKGVTYLMQFSGTTCSHMQNVINVIECARCLQDVIAGTHFSSRQRHKMETKSTFWSQPAQFDHWTFHFHFLSLIYTHIIVWCTGGSIVPPLSSFWYIFLSIHILHQDPIVLVRYTVCPGYLRRSSLLWIFMLLLHQAPV